MHTPEKSKVIMVHSYKGGTGKSAVAINLAQYLAIKLKKKILIIEQDIGGSSFSSIFQIRPKKTWNDFYNTGELIKNLVYNWDYFDVICARGEDIQIPHGQEPRTFFARHLERLNMQKKWLIANYDFIILDTHPGFAIELINSILIADIAILLTRLDIDTVTNTIKMYDRVYSEFQNKKIILVQNQIPEPVNNISKSPLDLNIKQAMDKWNDFVKDKLLLTIPLKNEIAYTLSRNKIVPLDNIFMKYIQQISELILK
ncbi:MAG: ParA family protein [Candidatus Hodarchaeota archaeon]